MTALAALLAELVTVSPVTLGADEPDVFDVFVAGFWIDTVDRAEEIARTARDRLGAILRRHPEALRELLGEARRRPCIGCGYEWGATGTDLCPDCAAEDMFGVADREGT